MAPEGEDVDHEAGLGPTPLAQEHEAHTISSDSVLTSQREASPKSTTNSAYSAGSPPKQPIQGADGMPLSPTSASRREFGQNVIRELSEMKDDLWDRFDKNKDGLLSTPEATSFIKNLLKSFIAVLAEDVPEGTAEKAALNKTLPDKSVQKKLAVVFLNTLDVDKDGQTTRQEFYNGFETGLRAVLEELLLIHFGGQKQALEVATAEIVIFINSPGLKTASNTKAGSHKILIHKKKTLLQLREMIEAELGIKKAHQRLWIGFSQLTELSTERNDYTLEECGRMDPPLRSMDNLHLCGADGTQVTECDRLVVSVTRLKRSRSFGSDPVFVQLHPEWAGPQQTACVTAGAVTDFEPGTSTFEWRLDPHKLSAKAGRSSAFFSVKLFQQSKPQHIAEAYINLEEVINDPDISSVLGPYSHGRFIETPIPLTMNDQQGNTVQASKPHTLVLRFGYRPSD